MDIFPEVEEVEEIEEETEETTVTHGKDLEFDFEEGDIRLSDGRLQMVDGKKALIQWIGKLLLTERDKYDIYSTYGVATKEIVYGDGPKLFKKAELQDDIQEKLLEHPAISTVSEFDFVREGINEVAKFTLDTEYGEIHEEVIISG